ncbi:MAG: hypothetical protein ACM3X4_05605 [Ignavibacteriales bacterium]
MLVWFVIAALTLVIMALAHSTGRRAGLAEGRRLALLEAYLMVREEALRSGACPVCGACCHERHICS